MQILAWLNDLLQTDYARVEDLSDGLCASVLSRSLVYLMHGCLVTMTGVAFVQALDALMPRSNVHLDRLNCNKISCHLA